MSSSLEATLDAILAHHGGGPLAALGTPGKGSRWVELTPGRPPPVPELEAGLGPQDHLLVHVAGTPTEADLASVAANFETSPLGQIPTLRPILQPVPQSSGNHVNRSRIH